MVGAGARIASLERAVLEDFWEAMAFQPGIDGEKQLSCQDLGVGASQVAVALRAKAGRHEHECLESNKSFWLYHNFYFKGKWALRKGFH